jgi:hypothetical protein
LIRAPAHACVVSLALSLAGWGGLAFVPARAQAQAQAAAAAPKGGTPLPPSPAPAAGEVPPAGLPLPPETGGGQAPAPAAPPNPIPEAPSPAPVPPSPREPQPPPYAAVPASPAPLRKDELPNAGYVPGYRDYKGLALSPFAPRVGALPGITPGYAAPMPLGQWTFRFSGFLSASLQSGIGQRQITGEGQTNTVFHVPPQVLDEYGSFLGTGTLPGQWVALNFAYGNGIVSANISLNTWNPSQPSTYYQIGSQYFVNNAFLDFDVPALGPFKIHTQAGYFYNYYGNLGPYGPGLYTNSIVGSPRGVGETTTVTFQARSDLLVLLEHGIMGNRDGKIPDDVVPNGGNGSANPIFPAAWIHHLHLGVVRTGDPTLRAEIHYLTTWSQDDRVQRAQDNPVTRYIDESAPKDGRIDVLGADASVQSNKLGYLAVAGSYVRGNNASTLHGLFTYGGEGQTLADRWWGQTSQGTGSLYAAGVNWTGSLGRIVSGSAASSNDQPDLVLNVGLVMAYTLAEVRVLEGTTDPTYTADIQQFNHRFRYKFGADGVYTFLPWMAAALRVDRVAPTSKDDGETFYVVAPRLIFKSSWLSRETLTLVYAKWFLGPRTHNESGSIVNGDLGLDDQLIAVNVNIWW